MKWFHHRAFLRQHIDVTSLVEATQLHCEMGIVATGKARVFHAFYTRLYLEDGTALEGRDPYNLRPSLTALADEAHSRGLTLNVCGLSPSFYETGLSSNSGYGYLRGRDELPAVHMLEPIPVP